MRRNSRTETESGRIRLTVQDAYPGETQRRGTSAGGAGLLTVLGCLLFFLILFSFLFIVPYNEFRFTPAWIWSHVRERFAQFYALLFGTDAAFGVTVCRYLAVVLVGAALAATGCIFQGSFRNRLAGPSTMGVMSGGSLGCMIYLLCFTEYASDAVNGSFDAAAYASRTFFDIYAQQLCTLAGCFGAVALVLGIASAAGHGRISSHAMIMSGSVFASLTGTVSMLIQYYLILTDPDDSRIEAVRDLMMGSFDRIDSWRTLALLAVPLLICLALLLAARARLNLFALSEEEAVTMGIDTRTLRYAVIVLGTVLTAFVVAFCGHVGFLGFMVPLLGHRLAGPDMNRLLPACMLIGAILLTVIYDAAYIFGLTSYLNLFTGIIGSITMLVLLLRRKGGAQNGNTAFRSAGAMGMH